jgi:hypothetical protein
MKIALVGQSVASAWIASTTLPIQLSPLIIESLLCWLRR